MLNFCQSVYIIIHLTLCTLSFEFKERIRSCMLRELTPSLLVAISTRSETGSHNRLDLIQSLVPTHYVCKAFLFNVLPFTLKSVFQLQIGLGSLASCKTWSRTSHGPALSKHTATFILTSNTLSSARFSIVNLKKIKWF